MEFWQVVSWCETGDLVEVARIAEETGFDGLILAEHMFYPRYTFSTDGSGGTYDIQSIAVHELGHWLRLNDVYSWPWESKVMYFTINTGTLRRALQQDDINGINAIYP